MQELLKRLKKNDTTAFEQLYRAAYPPSASYVLNNKGTAIDAQGIFQEAMLLFLLNLRQTAFEPTDEPTTYLEAITKQLWLKQLKKSDQTSSINTEVKDLPNLVVNSIIVEEEVKKERQQLIEVQKKLQAAGFFEEVHPPIQEENEGDGGLPSVVVQLWKVRRTWVAAVAVLVFIVVGINLLMPPKATNNYASYYTPYPDKISEGITLEIEENAPSELSSLKDLQTAMQHYKVGAHKKAIPLYKKYLSENQASDRYYIVRFYLANSYLATEQPQQAEDVLTALKDTPPERTDDLRWYLALAYAQNGKNKQAISLLKRLIQDSNTYQGDAQKLLNELQ